MKIIKYNPVVYILGLTPLLIYFSIDNSFNMMMLLPVTFLLFIFKLVSKELNFLNTKVIIYSLIILFIYILSVLSNFIFDNLHFSSATLVRLLYTMSIFVYVILATSFSFEKKELQTIFVLNIICGFIIALNIIYLYVIGMSGKLSIINVFGNKVEENYTSSLLAFYVAIGMQFILYKKKNNNRLCFMIFIIVVGIFLTGSRASFLSLCLFAGFIILKNLFFNNKMKFYKKIVYFIIILSVVTIVYLNLEKILPPFIYQRFFVNDLNDNSNNVRLMIWNHGFQGLLKRPLLGYGIGNFVNYLQKFIYMNNTVVAHNTFLDIALDGGIICLLVFLLFIYDNIKYYIKKDKNSLGIIGVLFFTAFIVGAERTYFFWNGITSLILISNYVKKSSEEENVFEI